MIIKQIVFETAKQLSVFVLGGAILWEVAMHAGPPNSEVVVHVPDIWVDVTVDGTLHRIESVEQTPIVCELSPGIHTLRMFREGQVLYEEVFTVVPNKELVLTAWDRTRLDLEHVPRTIPPEVLPIFRRENLANRASPQPDQARAQTP